MTVRLVVARPLPGTVGESRRVVHVFPVAVETTPERLTAYCGAAFGPGELELLERPVGMPCVNCLRRAPSPGSAEQPAIER
ncbi:hypothetical protein SAMN05421837_102833 [Amycolatopsis pretoriensis]|uniref:Uncharacterized protein n=1 Tax=Amycolatopsis pretoriensis TaxID=218821 RepID=A0A1H5QFU8_9PSEU|nr:hypothetical protein [Amycolatopsis pretoriensis]SEF24724.1 hypothetical protein SAMN05421837_102833 [Amycolatopsis pretoriensis]